MDFQKDQQPKNLCKKIRKGSVPCVKSLLCVQNCLSGVWWNKLGDWSLPNTDDATGEGDCSLSLKRWQEATLHLHNIYTREMQDWHPPTHTPVPQWSPMLRFLSQKNRNKKEESSNSSTFRNLLVINERLVREKRNLSYCCFFFSLKKKEERNPAWLHGSTWNVQQERNSMQKAVHETAHSSYLATHKNNGNTAATYSRWTWEC